MRAKKAESLLMKQMLSVMHKSLRLTVWPMGDMGKDMLTDDSPEDLTRSRSGGLADVMFKQFAEQILMGDLAAGKLTPPRAPKPIAKQNHEN